MVPWSAERHGDDDAVQILSGAVWRTIRSRNIPGGAYGADPATGGFNKFALDLDVQHAGTFRVIAVPAAGVSLFEDWRHERNPEATVLKVATYNTLFNSESFDASKYANIANLLGTRGSLDPLHHRIEERRDQAPFQWESDVIGMQEVIKEHDDNAPDDKYTAVMLDELKLRGPLDWTFAQGCGETWDCVVVGGCSDGPGMNPTFVNSNFFPTELPASAYFSSAAKKRADCYDRDGHPYYNECHLSKQGMGDGDTYNYATTAKVAEWRGGADARLIAMFNVHMEASKGPKDFAPRVGEIRSLLKIMDRLLEADHLAFNGAAETDEHKPSPLHHQNRAIIMGDWNVCAHECGEHYWMVRMLREHFGYAVDVSMVLPDANGSLKQTMHTGDFGYGADEVPIGYQHMTSDDPRPGPAWLACQSTHVHSASSAFRWWATDWRNKKSTADKAGERLSMIVLVGSGWEYDDPVLSYAFMRDRNFVSPMNPSGRGAEM
ncbi:hypothetical protein [Sorangium sp. So ce124]|uniref:hypothetical protein n=1 Tax=Sorangium sp. So ce124 TaxID=3133280 RepID=UPI003F5FAB12